MRPLPPILLGIAALAAAPALAQTVSPGATGGTTAEPTLNQRIDGAAGLNSTRSPHDSGPLSVPLARGAAVASPTTKALEKAGSPSGPPLGTSGPATPTDPDPPTPAAARHDDPRTPS